MARNGKIARLSVDIRNELNRRLQDGEPGTHLVEWLNGQKSVRTVLKEEFGGRPILEQNLSEWRQGGYKDWLRLEAARDFIENMSEQSGVLDDASGGEMISDCFGSVLAAEMAQLAMKFLEQEDDLEKRWNRLKEINREFSRMRRDDHRALRTGIKREQWEWKQEQEEDAVDEKRRCREREAAWFGGLRRTAPAPAKPGWAKPKAQAPAGGGPGPKAEPAKQQPAVGQKPETHHAKDEMTDPAGHRPAIRNQSESNPPSQGYGSARSFRTGTIKPNPGESNQIKVNQTKPAKPGLPSDTIKGKPGVPGKVEGPGLNFERARLEKLVPEGS